MGLPSTHKALKDNLAGGRLLLGKKTLEVHKVDEVLLQALGKDKIEFSDVQSVELDAQAIRFTGKAQLFNIPDLKVRAKIFESGGAQQIVLEADLLSNWDPNAAKPQYPPNCETIPELIDKPFLTAMFQQLGREKSRLVFSSFAHQNLEANVSLEKGMNLVWTYAPADGSPPISLSAPVKLEDGALVCRLSLPYSITMGSTSLDQIEAFFELPNNAVFAPARYGLQGKLKVGDLQLDVTGVVNIFDLDLELFAESQSLVLNGPQALKSLTGVPDAAAKLSADLKALPGLKLTRAALCFNPIRQKVLRTSVTIETTKTWKALSPHFTVTGIALDLSMANPWDTASRAITGWLTGKMKVAGVDVTVQASFPHPVIVGKMDAGQTLTLKKLLGEYAPAVKNVPAIALSRLSTMVDPENSVFALAAVVEGDWKFDVGAATVLVKEIGCDVVSADGDVSGAVYGIFRLASCDFAITASFPDFEFSAQAVDATEISLKELLGDLTAGVVALPPTLPDLKIVQPHLHAKPKIGDFSLSAICRMSWKISLGAAAFDIRDISWRVERKKDASDTLVWTASMSGSFQLHGLNLLATVEKFGSAANAWRLTSSLTRDQPIKLKDFLKGLMPAGAGLPDSVADIKIKKARLAYDFEDLAFQVDAETDATISFAGLGSVTARGIAFQIAPRPGQPAKSDWRIKLIGSLKMTSGFELAGSLDCFDEAAGSGLAFVPIAQTPVGIPLPFPKYKNKNIGVNLQFGAISITEAAGKFAFDASVTVGFDHLPEFFDRLIADRATGSFRATENGIVLKVDRVFEGIEVPLPKIQLSATQQIDFGKMRFDITNLQLEVGEETTFSAMFGVGIPEKLNNLFGVKTNGKPQVELFRTYNPSRPLETLTRGQLAAGSAGVSFTLVDSPFQAISFKQENGKTWCECDFGDLGAVKFMLPILSLDVASSSFKGAGAMKVTRPIRLPLALIKNMLAANGQKSMADLLPDSIPLKAIKLLDAHDNIDVDMMAAHLESTTGGAARVPKEIKDTLKLFAGVFNKLPDRFRGYFDIALPDSFDFDIAVTPDGGVTVNVEVGGAPIKAFFANPPAPILFGIELRGFSFGEVLGGNLFLLKADGIVDMFDPYALAASFLPNVPFLADSRALQQSFVFKKLTMLIVYQTAIPIPIPLFYDELGYEYHGVEDFVFQTHVKFPMPKLDPMEIARIFGEFQKFASDKNYLMDTRHPPRNTDLKFTLGANYIQLPRYLGSTVLGKKTDLATISLYETVAGLLNGIKTFSVNGLVQCVPLQHRVGSQDVEFLGMKFRSQWLVTTPKEFSDGAYARLGLNASAKNDLLALVPRPVAATAPEGLVVFLQGSGSVAGAANWSGKFVLASVEGVGCATGFRVAGSLLNGLIGMDLAGSVKMLAKSPAPFELRGSGELTFLGERAMSAEVSYGPNGLLLKGFLDLFPTTSLLQLEGNVTGALGPDTFLLEGDVRFTLGQHFVLAGARAKVSEREFTVKGTWMSQSVELTMTRQAAGVRFAAGLSELVAPGNLFRLSGPSSMGGPNLAIDARQGAVPECTIAGAVQILGMTGQTQIKLTAIGCSFQVAGKIFGAFHASLEITSSIDLLKVDALHVKATMQADFFGAARAGVTTSLRGLAQQADARVNEVKAQLDKAKRDLDAAIAQVNAMSTQILNELKLRENQAKANITTVQNTVTQIQRQLNDVRARVNAEKAKAQRAFDDAEEKLDDIKDDIDDVKDDLKTWNKRLKACKPWELDKIADLGVKIAGGELKKAGLETAKAAAKLACDAAEAALNLAAAAVNAALSGLNQQLSAANRSLDDAKDRLSDVQKLIQNVGNDIRLAGVKAARDTKNALFDQAKLALEQIRQREKALLDIGAALANAATTPGVFEVTAASFSGSLNALHGGKVTLTLTVRVMRGAPKNLAVPFDFANPAAGMASIFTQVQQLI